MRPAKEEAARDLVNELTDNIDLARERIAKPSDWDWPQYDRERARLSRIALRAVRAAMRRPLPKRSRR